MHDQQIDITIDHLARFHEDQMIAGANLRKVAPFKSKIMLEQSIINEMSLIWVESFSHGKAASKKTNCDITAHGRYLRQKSHREVAFLVWLFWKASDYSVMPRLCAL